MTDRQGLPSARLGAARRGSPAVIVAAAFLGALVVGTAMVLTTGRGGEGESIVPPVDTMAETTTVTTEPERGPGVPPLGLVAREAWPSPAVDPVLALPVCPDETSLASFLAAEFPEAVDHDYEAIDPRDLASTIPLPRIGHLSLFTTDDLTDSCLGAGRRGDIIGWWMGDASGVLIARAAARDVGIVEVPAEASGGPYIQWRDASMHPFTGSVYSNGRAQVLAGAFPGRYTVIEVPDRVPADDTGADRLAASLAATPVRMDLLIGSLALLPTGLPEGYGVCLGDLFQLGAGWLDSTIYCDGGGDYIEIHGHESSAAHPDIADVAEPTRVGGVDAHTWTADGRLWIVIEAPRVRFGGAPVRVSASGPSDMPAGTLEAVLASTGALRSAVVAPRSGAGDLTGSMTAESFAKDIAAAGASSVTPRDDPLAPGREGVSVDFVLDIDIVGDAFAVVEDRSEWLSGDFVELAFLMGVTDAVSLGPVDALLADDEGALAARFACGGVTFAVWLYRDGEPPLPRDPFWSTDPERRAHIVAFLGRLVDAIGCEA